MEIYHCTFCNKEHDNWYVRPDNGKRECRARRANHAVKYKENNLQEVKSYKKEWQQGNADHLSQYQRTWRAESEKWEQYKPIKAQKQAERNKERYNTELIFRIERKLRRRLWEAIKRDPGSTFSNSLGCSIDFLLKYLESKFYPHPFSGKIMTWENYGAEWHIDHIEPLYKFDLSDPVQYATACRYVNLQPLWVEDHIEKTKKDLRG
jgi:hypothetical protein